MRHSDHSSLHVWRVLVGVASTLTWNEDVLCYYSMEYTIHQPECGVPVFKQRSVRRALTLCSIERQASQGVSQYPNRRVQSQ
jgi:hypothetical protein